MANVIRLFCRRLIPRSDGWAIIAFPFPIRHLSTGRVRHYSTESDILYRPMKEADKPIVRQFLYGHFFNRYPPCRILGMNPLTDCRATVDQVFATTPLPLSMMALDSSGHVIGLSLQNVMLPDHSNCRKPLMPLDTSLEKEKILYTFHGDFLANAVLPRVDIFQKYGVDVYLKMRCATVHSAHGGKGIIKNIVQEVANIGKDNGISCVAATAINILSMRALDKLGFECVLETPIAEFLYDGKPVFRGSDEMVFVMAKMF